MVGALFCLFALCLLLALCPVPSSRRKPCVGCGNEEQQEICKDGCLPYSTWAARGMMK